MARPAPRPARNHVGAVREDYNRRSAQWEAIYRGTSYHDHLLRDRLERSVALLGRPPRGGGRAVDVGCGAGQLVAALAERGWEASGCDVAELQAQAARRLLVAQGHPAAALQADGDHLPFADGTFEAVAALGYVEYLPVPASAVRELARIAAPGARLVVTAPNRLRLNYLADPVGVARGYLFPEHRGYRRHYFTRAGLVRVLQQAGLVVVSVDGHGLGRFTMAGFPLVDDRRSIGLDRRLGRRLPSPVSAALGADLVALATKPG